MSDKYISYEKGIEKLDKMTENISRKELNRNIIELTIIISMALQKFEKLGILQEFYEEFNMPPDLIRHLNRFKKSVKKEGFVKK